MKNADAFSRNHLNLEIKTYLYGTLTSHIVIDPRPSETESGLQALAKTPDGGLAGERSGFAQ
jgi:hypothetical protein